MKKFAIVAAAIIAILSQAHAVMAQYLGVTCGWNYSNDLGGPNTGMANTPLFNPDPNNPSRTWDEWVEELEFSGVDFVCPNLRGSYPVTDLSPANLTPLVTAINNRGLTNRLKVALFDDNASSWTAQWNQANGRGFGYAQPFDISDPNNYKYLWDYNYKIFYQTIPDANLFKINGRPLIIIWTGNTYFIGNMPGNMSKALLYVRQQCKSTFGMNPFIIASGDTLDHDPTCNDPAVVDGIQRWFNPSQSGAPGWTLSNFNGTLVGAACPQFQTAANGGWVDPNHGNELDVSLQSTVNSGALVTLVEGFSDWEEDAALFRGANLSSSGAPLDYSTTYYDYPNQRLNVLRKHSSAPFPATLKVEIEGCDTFSGGLANRTSPNYYRNGNIEIQRTSDTGGGWDVENIQPGESFTWQELPIQGSTHLFLRAATNAGNCRVHFVIDGASGNSVTLPNTGGLQTWTTVDAGAYGPFATGSTHTVTLVCETGSMNLNYWQLGSGGATVPSAPTGLTASAAIGQVSLSWTASTGASSYSVYRGTSAGGESATAIVTGITTTSYTNTSLTNGTRYYYTVKAVNGSGSSGASNEANATPSSGSSTPYGGSPVQIAATGATSIEAENYDLGGEAIAYHSAYASNPAGSTYRSSDSVAIYDDPAAGNTHGIGWTTGGEWQKYTVNVAAAGTYTIAVKVASTSAISGALHVADTGGANLTGAINVPNTGAWTTYRATTAATVSLSAGAHTLQLFIDNGGYNIDSIVVNGAAAAATKFNQGQYLGVNQYIVSPSKNCFLVQQSDGNLVLYKGSSPSDNHGGIWASLTASQPNGNYFTILQSDGNLVTYKGTGPNDNQGFVWCNFTQGNDFLQIMDSQQLQVISGTTVLWQKP